MLIEPHVYIHGHYNTVHCFATATLLWLFFGDARPREFVSYITKTLLLSNECHVIQKVAEIHAVRLSLVNLMHDACGRHAIISWLVSLFVSTCGF